VRVDFTVDLSDVPVQLRGVLLNMPLPVAALIQAREPSNHADWVVS
jgi:hypothetical protein